MVMPTKGAKIYEITENPDGSVTVDTAFGVPPFPALPTGGMNFPSKEILAQQIREAAETIPNEVLVMLILGDRWLKTDATLNMANKSRAENSYVVIDHQSPRASFTIGKDV